MDFSRCFYGFGIPIACVGGGLPVFNEILMLYKIVAVYNGLNVLKIFRGRINFRKIFRIEVYPLQFLSKRVFLGRKCFFLRRELLAFFVATGYIFVAEGDSVAYFLIDSTPSVFFFFGQGIDLCTDF